MKRIAFLVFATHILFGTHASARQEIYVKSLQTQEVFKTPITKGSATSSILAVTTTDKTVKLLDIVSLKERSTLSGLINPASLVSLTASGQSVVTACVDGQVAIWSTSTGMVSKEIARESEQFTALVVQNESLVYLAGSDKNLRILDALSGKEIGSVSASPDDITEICLNPNGKEIAVGTSSGRVNIYALGELGLTRSLPENKEKVSALSYSLNGRLLVAGTSDGNLYIWETQNWTSKTKINQGKRGISSISFDPLLRWMASGSVDSTLKIYDLYSFAQVKSLVETNGYCTFVSFVNDETLVAATSRGFVQKWRVLPAPPDTLAPKIIVLRPAPTSKESAVRTVSSEFEIHGIAYDDIGVNTLVVNGKPVKVTAPSAEETSKVPEGMKAKAFTATVKLESFGTNTLEINATDKAGHTSKDSAFVNHLTIDQSVEIIAPTNNALFNTVSTPIQFRAWFEVESYSIAVNVSDIPTNAVLPGKSVGDLIQDDVPLVVGENQIQLTVLGKQGERFSKSFSVSRKSEGSVTLNPPLNTMKRQRGPGPQAWAVVVGLSEYGNKGIPSLTYADKDADALANFLRRPEGGGYDTDHLKVLLNKDATLSNIKDALINFLNQAIDIDLVMIYFAGHGAPEPARPQNLYLLTYDSDPNMLGTTAFPMWQIQDLLARYINAKRIIVFSDACHSGGISANFATRGMGVTENNLINQYLTDLSKTKEGVVVFTASAAGEVSQEFPDLGHGVFTYYLLEGLEGKADLNNDYVVTINEEMQYVEEQVKRKTKGAQNPTRSQTSYDKELTIATIPH